jgi:hypothetical protein
MSGVERFKSRTDEDEATDLLVSTLGLIVAGVVGFSMFLLTLSFTEIGRKRAKKEIQKVKAKFIWN